MSSLDVVVVNIQDISNFFYYLFINVLFDNVSVSANFALFR